MTYFAAVLVVLLEGGAIGLKDAGHIVPPGGTQGLVGRDGDIGTVGLTSRVFEVPVRARARGVPGGGLAEIGDVGLRIKDVPGLAVDLVQTETRVEIRIGTDGGSDPSGGDRALGLLAPGP